MYTKNEAPVIMALDRAEVNTILRAIKNKTPDYFETFAGISIRQMTENLELFNVILIPHENKSTSEIMRSILTITKTEK